MSEANEMASSFERVYADKKQINTFGVIDYLNSNYIQHDVTDTFARAVQDLPENLDSNANKMKYYNFFGQFGTVS